MSHGLECIGANCTLDARDVKQAFVSLVAGNASYAKFTCKSRAVRNSTECLLQEKKGALTRVRARGDTEKYAEVKP